MPKPIWWNNNPDYLDSLTGPAKMLLGSALDRGLTVLTGTARGVLEDEASSAYGDFLAALIEKTKGQYALTGGPFFGRGALKTMITWDSGVLTTSQGLDGKVDVDVACWDEKIYQEIGTLLTELLLPEYVRQPIYAITMYQGEPSIEEVGTAGVAFEPRNYAPDAVEGFNFIVENLTNAQPYGRLSIIEGAPGTGKTYFLRGILQEVLDAVFLIVSSDIVESLTGSLMSVLIKARGVAGPDKPLVLVIEDADECLKARKEGQNTAAISAILNLSDGIIGQSLDLRILTTTNLPKEAIDDALRRPGRLSKFITIGPLSGEQATEVYDRIFGESDVAFKDPHTLAQIFAEAYLDKRTLEIENEAANGDEDDEFDDDDDEDEDDEDEDDEDEDELATRSVAANRHEGSESFVQIRTPSRCRCIGGTHEKGREAARQGVGCQG